MIPGAVYFCGLRTLCKPLWEGCSVRPGKRIVRKWVRGGGSMGRTRCQREKIIAFLFSRMVKAGG